MGTTGTTLIGSGLFGGPLSGPPPPPTSGVKVSDIIYHAYRALGQLGAPQRIVSPEETIDGIAVLNFLTESWNIERLMIPALQRITYLLVANQQQYQIGPTASDFLAERPSRLEYASVIISTGYDSPFERQLFILPPGLWQQVQKKGIVDPLPRAVYYDKDFPNGNIFVWPIPSLVMQICLYTWKVIPSFASETDAVVLAPGYFRALYLNTAVELAARYPHLKISDFTVKEAAVAKQAVMVLNSDLFPGETPAASGPAAA